MTTRTVVILSIFSVAICLSNRTLLPYENAGTKADCEIKYWLSRLKAEGHHKMVTSRTKEYEYLMTTRMGMSRSDYVDTRVADVGPGPRGSLEWADMTKLRVGIDPLANAYVSLGVAKQKMSYVVASASDIPFPDRYFDIVTSINSLDHVADVGTAVKEMQRILRPGGLFLLSTDVNHRPTPCEPNEFDWDIVHAFEDMEVVTLKKYEKYAPQNRHRSASKTSLPTVTSDSQPYDFANPTPRYGVLIATLRKKG